MGGREGRDRGGGKESGGRGGLHETACKRDGES